MSTPATRFRPRLESLEDRCVPAVVGTATENFVEQVYQDILHRSADAGGRAFWTNAINTGQIDRNEFALLIQSSQEGRLALVNDTYQRFLNRNADQGGLAFWSQYLADGHTTVEFQAQIIGSQEYFLINGGTNQSFMSAVYRDVLGRTASANEINAWLSSGWSRTEIAEAILESREGRMAEVSLAYQSYLRRGVDQGGLNFWTDQLLSESLEGDIDVEADDAAENFEDNTDAVFTAFLLGSQEYFQQNTSYTGPAPYPSF